MKDIVLSEAPCSKCVVSNKTHCCRANIPYTYEDYEKVMKVLSDNTKKEFHLVESPTHNYDYSYRLIHESYGASNLEELPCVFFNREKRICNIYEHRPEICRVYGSDKMPCKYQFLDDLNKMFTLSKEEHDTLDNSVIKFMSIKDKDDIIFNRRAKYLNNKFKAEKAINKSIIINRYNYK